MKAQQNSATGEQAAFVCPQSLSPNWSRQRRLRMLAKCLIVGLAMRGWLSPAVAQWLIYVGGLVHD